MRSGPSFDGRLYEHQEQARPARASPACWWTRHGVKTRGGCGAYLRGGGAVHVQHLALSLQPRLPLLPHQALQLLPVRHLLPKMQRKPQAHQHQPHREHQRGRAVPASAHGFMPITTRRAAGLLWRGRGDGSARSIELASLEIRVRVISVTYDGIRETRKVDGLAAVCIHELRKQRGTTSAQMVRLDHNTQRS